MDASFPDLCFIHCNKHLKDVQILSFSLTTTSDKVLFYSTLHLYYLHFLLFVPCLSLMVVQLLAKKEEKCACAQ